MVWPISVLVKPPISADSAASGDPTGPRHGFLEQFQPLADKVVKGDGKPCDVTAWPRQVGDEALCYRITSSSEDDGDSRRRLLGGYGGECASSGQDDMDLEHNQFGRESGEPLGVTLCPALIDRHVLALGVTCFAQSLTERGQRHLRVARADTEVANHRHRRLLRAYTERPSCRCTTQERDEIATLHLHCPRWRGSSLTRLLS